MLRHSIKFGLAVIALVVGLQAGGAQAAVASQAMATVAATQSADILAVRWVCGPNRCAWRPGHPGPLHPWATGWGPPRNPNCFWERVRGGPWVEVCR